MTIVQQLFWLLVLDLCCVIIFKRLRLPIDVLNGRRSLYPKQVLVSSIHHDVESECSQDGDKGLRIKACVLNVLVIGEIGQNKK